MTTIEKIDMMQAITFAKSNHDLKQLLKVIHKDIFNNLLQNISHGQANHANSINFTRIAALIVVYEQQGICDTEISESLFSEATAFPDPECYILIRMLLLCQVQLPCFLQDLIGQLRLHMRNGGPLPVFVQNLHAWKMLQEHIDLPFHDMPRHFFTEYKLLNTMRFAIIKPCALQICMQLHALELDANCMCEIVMAALEPTARELPFYYIWNLVTKVKHFFDKTKNEQISLSY